MIATRESALFLFEREEPINAHRYHWNLELLRKYADAGAECAHLAVGGAAAFREDQYAVTSIDRLTGKGEAVAEAGALRKREDIEQSGNQPIREVLDRPLKAIHFRSRNALASLCRDQLDCGKDLVCAFAAQSRNK